MNEIDNEEKIEIFEKKVRELFYGFIDDKKIYEIESEDRMKALARLFVYSLVALRKKDFKDSAELIMAFSFAHQICLKTLIQFQIKLDKYSLEEVRKLANLLKESVYEDYENIEELIKEAMSNEWDV